MNPYWGNKINEKEVKHIPMGWMMTLLHHFHLIQKWNKWKYKIKQSIWICFYLFFILFLLLFFGGERRWKNVNDSGCDAVSSHHVLRNQLWMIDCCCIWEKWSSFHLVDPSISTMEWKNDEGMINSPRVDMTTIITININQFTLFWKKKWKINKIK